MSTINKNFKVSELDSLLVEGVDKVVFLHLYDVRPNVHQPANPLPELVTLTISMVRETWVIRVQRNRPLLSRERRRGREPKLHISL